MVTDGQCPEGQTPPARQPSYMMHVCTNGACKPVLLRAEGDPDLLVCHNGLAQDSVR